MVPSVPAPCWEQCPTASPTRPRAWDGEMVASNWGHGPGEQEVGGQSDGEKEVEKEGCGCVGGPCGQLSPWPYTQ